VASPSGSSPQSKTNEPNKGIASGRVPDVWEKKKNGRKNGRKAIRFGRRIRGWGKIVRVNVTEGTGTKPQGTNFERVIKGGTDLGVTRIEPGKSGGEGTAAARRNGSGR